MYYSDEQQKYQAVHQSVDDAIGAYYDVIKTNGNYGHQLQYLKEEVNLAYEQINEAIGRANGAERAQLEKYQQDLQQIVVEANRYE